MSAPIEIALRTKPQSTYRIKIVAEQNGSATQSAFMYSTYVFYATPIR